jgi:hypothetical protein
VIVEANTLRMGIVGRPGEIDRAIQSAWFWAGVHVRQLGATARPAALVYSALLSRRVGKYVGLAGRAVGRQGPPVPWPTSVALSPEAERAAADVYDLLAQVQRRGVKVMLVRLPCRQERSGDWLDVAREASRRTGCVFLDLEDRLGSANLQFTDDVHMDSASAAACLDEMLGAYASMQ